MEKIEKENYEYIKSCFPFVCKEKFDNLTLSKKEYNQHVISFKAIDDILISHQLILTKMYKQYPLRLIKCLRSVFRKYRVYFINNDEPDTALFKFNNEYEFVGFIHDKVWDIDNAKEFVLVEEAKLIIFVGYEVSLTLFFKEMNTEIEKIVKLFIKNGASVSVIE